MCGKHLSQFVIHLELDSFNMRMEDESKILQSQTDQHCCCYELPRRRGGKESALPTQETWERQVLSLGQKDLLGKETAMHSSILAWKVSWTEEPGGLQSMGSQRVGTTEQRSAHTAAAAAASRHWRRTVCSSMWFPRLLCQSANDMCLHWPLFWLKT